MGHTGNQIYNHINLYIILWSELGTKEDYQAEYQDKPLGELVREIVGLCKCQ